MNNTKRIDTQDGISINPNRISEAGDSTHAVICTLLRYNVTEKATEVLLVRYKQPHVQEMPTTRLLAGSGEEKETVFDTLMRKVEFLSGLIPNKNSVVFLSEIDATNSSKDPTRINETHTKFSCLITDWYGELITSPDLNAETSAPYWLSISEAFDSGIFYPHKVCLSYAITYARKNMAKTFPDLVNFKR